MGLRLGSPPIAAGGSLRQILACGNSYALAVGGAAVAGASQAKYRYTTAVADRFGAAEHNVAVNGAYMHRPHLIQAGDGGYADILQAYAPSRTSMPALSDIDAAILSTGLNDCAVLGSAGLAPAIEATRRVICRLRAGAVFEDSDASVAYDSNWSLHTQTFLNSGPGTHNTTTVGAQATISIPSWFAGGEIGLAFALANGFVSNASIAVDGVLADQFAYGSAFVPAASQYTGIVRRLAGLTPGAHTAVITALAGTTILVFDSWEMPALSPPIVEHPLQPRLATPGTNTQSSDIATLNGLIRSLGASFADGRVRNPDLDTPIGGKASLFNGGAIGGAGDHMNDEGHQVAAGVVAADLEQALALYGNEAPAAATDLWHFVQPLAGNAPYNEPLFANGWVNAGVAGYSTAAFRRGPGGKVSLAGLIKTGAGGTTAFTLPDGFRPPLNRIRENIINSGGAPAASSVTILSTGAVQPTASGTSWTSLDGVEFDAA